MVTCGLMPITHLQSRLFLSYPLFTNTNIGLVNGPPRNASGLHFHFCHATSIYHRLAQQNTVNNLSLPKVFDGDLYISCI